MEDSEDESYDSELEDLLVDDDETVSEEETCEENESEWSDDATSDIDEGISGSDSEEEAS